MSEEAAAAASRNELQVPAVPRLAQLATAAVQERVRSQLAAAQLAHALRKCQQQQQQHQQQQQEAFCDGCDGCLFLDSVAESTVAFAERGVEGDDECGDGECG